MATLHALVQDEMRISLAEGETERVHVDWSPIGTPANPVWETDGSMTVSSESAVGFVTSALIANPPTSKPTECVTVTAQVGDEVLQRTFVVRTRPEA